MAIFFSILNFLHKSADCEWLYRIPDHHRILSPLSPSLSLSLSTSLFIFLTTKLSIFTCIERNHFGLHFCVHSLCSLLSNHSSDFLLRFLLLLISKYFFLRLSFASFLARASYQTKFKIPFSLITEYILCKRNKISLLLFWLVWFVHLLHFILLAYCMAIFILVYVEMPGGGGVVEQAALKNETVCEHGMVELK